MKQKNNVEIWITKNGNFYECKIISEKDIKIRKTGGTRFVKILGLNPYSNNVEIILEYLGAAFDFVDNVHTKCGRLLETAIINTFSKNYETFNYDPSKNELAGDAFIADPDFSGLPDFFCNDKLVLGEIKTAGINKKITNWNMGGYSKYSKNGNYWEIELKSPQAYLIQLFLMFDMAKKNFKTPPKSCVLITAFIADKEKIVNELEKINDLKEREKLAYHLVKDLDFHIETFEKLPADWENIKKTALEKRDELLGHREGVFKNHFYTKIPINEKTINFINELKKAKHIKLNGDL